jgi:hypothetical protein
LLIMIFRPQGLMGSKEFKLDTFIKKRTTKVN